MKNSEQPAFPFMWDQSYKPQFAYEPGLTKREYFAAMAMQGICANQPFLNNLNGECKLVAMSCVEIADALLAELEKPKAEG